MPNVDELIVKIGADFDELRRELGKANEGVDGFSDNTKKAGRVTKAAFGVAKKAGEQLKGALVALSGAATFLVKKQAEAAKATIEWADRLAMSRAEFSKLAAVGARFGASVDDIGDSIKDLNERIADAAAGNKTYEEALNRAGLASRDLINLPLEEQFIKVAAAIGRMNNAGDQNFVTAELMADAGFRLLPVMRQGEQAIRAMGNETIRTGEALNKFQLAKLEKVNKSMLSMGQSTAVIGNALLDHLAPGFKEASRWMEKFAAIARDVLGQSESALKTKIEETREELKKYSDVGQTHREMVQGQTRQISRYNAKVTKKIGLMQELARAQSRLNALQEAGNKIASSGGGSPQIAADSGPPAAGDAKIALATNSALELARINSEKNAEIMRQDQEHAALMEEARIAADELAFIAASDKALQESLAIATKLEEERMAQEELAAMKEGFLNSELEREKRYNEKAKAMWKSGMMGKLKVSQSILGDMATLMNSESRKMFEIGKAAAIADATINTALMAVKSFNWAASWGGYPAGAIAAAAAVASGLVQIQNIQSQTFGGGGGVAGGGGGAGGADAPEQAAPENVIDATFNLQTSQGSVSTDQIRGVAQGLNEFVEDGGRIRSVKVI